MHMHRVWVFVIRVTKRAEQCKTHCDFAWKLPKPISHQKTITITWPTCIFIHFGCLFISLCFALPSFLLSLLSVSLFLRKCLKLQREWCQIECKIGSEKKKHYSEIDIKSIWKNEQFENVTSRIPSSQFFLKITTNRIFQIHRKEEKKIVRWSALNVLNCKMRVFSTHMDGGKPANEKKQKERKKRVRWKRCISFA